MPATIRGDEDRDIAASVFFEPGVIELLKRSLTAHMIKRSPSSCWYAATLLFCSRVGEKKAARPLWEERVVLFKSPSEQSAKSAANKYGRAEEHRYDNMYGELVVWRFAGTEKLEEIEQPTEDAGWEVASRFLRRATRA
jgi:hypothetical protein